MITLKKKFNTYLLQINIFCFVSLIGVEDLESSQDITTLLVSAPPPPPPKSAARVLALALAESAQQGSLQPQSSGLCTPQSPLPSQDAAHLQGSPQTLLKIFSEEGAASRASSPPLPNNQTPASSCPITSSPAIRQQAVDLPTTVVKLPDDTTCPTQTEPGSALSDPSQCPCSPSLASQIGKVPEQQQGLTGHVPVQTNSSSNSPAPNPSGSCRESEVLSKPEVRLIFTFSARYLVLVIIFFLK